MILSMTGFGKASKVYNNKKITAEVKSLNSKQLDFGVRTPQNHREIEMELRNSVSKALMRGKIDLFVYCEPIEGATSGTINVPMLKQYKAQIEEMAKELQLPEPADWYSTLLRMPDALKTDSKSTEVDEEELKVVKEDDPLWYYIGRFWFSEPTQDNTNMKVTLNYKVKPYKYKNYDSLTDIPWDDLTLDDVVQHYVFKDISVSGERTCEFKANAIGRAAVVPTFIAETDGEGLSIKLVNPELSISTERSLGNGKTTDPNFILSGINEENVCGLTVSGNGKLSIQFVSGEI